MVFTKVRIADVLAPKKGLSRSDWQRAFNKIAQKRFDFVLCDPRTLEVLKVVELNDKSHRKSARKARDELVRKSCADAQLSIIEVSAKSAYQQSNIANLIAHSAANDGTNIE